MGQHRSASGSILLGLDGFEVLAAQVVGGEWQLEVQTTATVVGCVGCGVWAEAHGRRLLCFQELPADHWYPGAVMCIAFPDPLPHSPQVRSTESVDTQRSKDRANTEVHPESPDPGANP